MDRVRCGIFSAKTNVPFRAGQHAVERALGQTLGQPPSLCLVFFSPRYSSPELVNGILHAISPEIVAGCSTNGEIASGYRRESVIAFVISSRFMRFGIGAIANEILANGGQEAYQTLYNLALQDLKNKVVLESSGLIVPENKEDITPDFGLIFLPGTDIDLEPKANEVILGLREIVGDLPLVGGTIGDDCNYEKGFVIHKDEFLEEHTLLILCRSDLKFSMAQKHGYSVKKELFLNKATRNNLQLINGMAAAEAYFSELNLPIVEVSDLRDEIPANNPLGIIDETTNALQVLFPMCRGRGSTELSISQIIPSETKLQLLEANPAKVMKTPLESVKEAFAKSSIKDPRVGLVFSCVGRSSFYYRRSLEEIEEIKSRFKYTDIGGAYFYGTLCGESNWLSEGTSTTLLIGNGLCERHLEAKKQLREKEGKK